MASAYLLWLFTWWIAPVHCFTTTLTNIRVSSYVHDKRPQHHSMAYCYEVRLDADCLACVWVPRDLSWAVWRLPLQGVTNDSHEIFWEFCSDASLENISIDRIPLLTKRGAFSGCHGRRGQICPFFVWGPHAVRLEHSNLACIMANLAPRWVSLRSWRSLEAASVPGRPQISHPSNLSGCLASRSADVSAHLEETVWTSEEFVRLLLEQPCTQNENGPVFQECFGQATQSRLRCQRNLMVCWWLL